LVKGLQSLQWTKRETEEEEKKQKRTGRTTTVHTMHMALQQQLDKKRHAIFGNQKLAGLTPKLLTRSL